MIKVNEFYRDNETKEVYRVQSVTDKSIVIAHCVRDKAWRYPVNSRLFKKHFTMLIGKERDRAEILSEIIYQIQAKKIRIKQNNYLFFKNNKGCHLNIWDHKYEGEQLHKVCEENICHVCIIGAAFVSAVKLHNKITVNEYTDKPHYSAHVFNEYLSKWFSFAELALMECAFERRNLQCAYDDYVYGEIPAAEDFAAVHGLYEPSQILEEIVANTLVNTKFMPRMGLAPK